VIPFFDIEISTLVTSIKLLPKQNKKSWTNINIKEAKCRSCSINYGGSWCNYWAVYIAKPTFSLFDICICLFQSGLILKIIEKSSLRWHQNVQRLLQNHLLITIHFNVILTLSLLLLCFRFCTVFSSTTPSHKRSKTFANWTAQHFFCLFGSRKTLYVVNVLYNQPFLNHEISNEFV